MISVFIDLNHTIITMKYIKECHQHSTKLSKYAARCENLLGFYLKVLVIKKPKTLNKSYQSLWNFEMSSEFCSYLKI